MGEMRVKRAARGKEIEIMMQRECAAAEEEDF